MAGFFSAVEGAMNSLLTSALGPAPNGGAHMGGRRGAPAVFQRTFECFPPAYWATASAGQGDALEQGDKIVLPASCLNELSRMNIQFPMMFEISNKRVGRKSHCSVLEFTAQEGNIYIPHWMMENLCLQPGQMVQLRNVVMKKGTYVKLRPHTTKFIELPSKDNPNPKVILERALRTFSCLTQNDTITISPPNLGKYKLDVVEVRPGHAISIIETDVVLDFDEPKDYAEYTSKQVLKAPPRKKKKKDEEKTSEHSPSTGGGGWGQYDDDEPAAAKSDPKHTSMSANPGKSDYFSKLSGGQRLNGKVIKSTSKGRGSALGSKTSGKGKSKRISEVVGNMEYIYSIDPETQERTLLRRIPIRNLGGGTGYRLKG